MGWLGLVSYRQQSIAYASRFVLSKPVPAYIYALWDVIEMTFENICTHMYK